MSKTNDKFVKFSPAAASAIVKAGKSGYATMGRTGEFLVSMAKLAYADTKGKPLDKEHLNEVVGKITDDEFARSRMRNVLRACAVLPEASRDWERKHGSCAYQAISNLAAALLRTRDKSGAFHVAKAIKEAEGKSSSRGVAKKPTREGSMKSAAIHLKSLRSLKFMPSGFAKAVAVLAAEFDIKI